MSSRSNQGEDGKPIIAPTGLTVGYRSSDARAWDIANRVPRLLARPLAQGVKFHLNRAGLGRKVIVNEDGQPIRDVRENLKIIERNVTQMQISSEVCAAAATIRGILNEELHEHNKSGRDALELVRCARCIAEALTRDKELVAEFTSYEDGLKRLLGQRPHTRQ